MQRFDRLFRLWEHRVSHDQLLLRSPKGEGRPANVDVIFVGVEYLELPTMLRELQICAPSADDRTRAERAPGAAVELEHLFTLESSERRYIVVAAGMTVAENTLVPFATSFEQFGAVDADEP